MRTMILILTCVAILWGCAGPPAPERPTPAEPAPAPVQPAPVQPAPEPPATTNAADYFPYTPGVTAVYEGKGNEFASYTIKVLYKENGLLEWRKETGGTTMAEVYRLEPQQVTLIYREGEAYDQAKRLGKPPNVNQSVLKAPITPGTTWKADDVTYTILSTTESVEAVGKKLSDVVVVEAKHPQSTTRWHFHKTYGMVLSVFESEGNVIESRLSTFTGP
ncbi:MAG TPA: hypothetical protein VD902_04200 [Symbiobacteriaceae bacterium]|nr:hypothetical protein [Symbiobacteriaceae bacterium]